MLPCEPYARGFSDSPVRSTPRARISSVSSSPGASRGPPRRSSSWEARAARASKSPLKSKSSALDLRRDFDLELSDDEEDLEIAAGHDSLLSAASRSRGTAGASTTSGAGRIVRWLDGVEPAAPAESRAARRRRRWAYRALAAGCAVLLLQGATVVHMLAGYHGDECAAVPRRPAPRRPRLDLYGNASARRLESRRKRKGARNGTSTTTTRAKSFHVRRPVRQSDLVFWGTHNSYHRRPRRFHFPYWNALIPQWQYSHPRLARQLDAGARHLELDVHVDSATRKALVYHVQSLDSRTRCYCLRDCLGSLVDWSRRRSGDHGLVVVLLEVKGTKSYVEDVASHFRGLGDDRYPESRDALRVIDDTIFDAFAPTPRSLLTPDDVAGGYASPGASVRDRGWPAADALRGAFAFALLDSSQEAQLTRAYDASRRPRAMFTMGSAVVGRDAAAIYKYDNPNNPDHFAAIQAAVRAGFLVRTRANTVKYVANYARFAKARESGAQLVSFEADAKSNWLRFVGNPASQCACDALALAGSDRHCDDSSPPCT